MATYTVDFTSKNDPTNVDAVNVGLRVSKDEEYFQFFLAAVSGVDLATASITPDDRWWSALAFVGIEAIKNEIRQGFAPNLNPAEATMIPISAASVTEVAASSIDLPELIDGLFTGQEIASFEL